LLTTPQNKVLGESLFKKAGTDGDNPAFPGRAARDVDHSMIRPRVRNRSGRISLLVSVNLVAA
jgi:hypothetical protein